MHGGNRESGEEDNLRDDPEEALLWALFLQVASEVALTDHSDVVLTRARRTIGRD